jgi:hypothetical protein
LPAPQHQRHLTARGPSKRDSATSPQQQPRPNAIPAQGNGQARRGTEEPPVPQCQPHLSTRGPSTQPLPILLSDSHDQTQSRQQGNKERARGAKGPPALQRRDHQSACAGHQHSLCHFSSATAMTECNRGARGTTSVEGGDKGEPAQQRG